MKVTHTVVCTACGGTGLYKGLAERGTCAVVCHRCNGTGAVQQTFEIFQERKRRPNVTKVYKDSCGYVHNETLDGGCTYEEFLAGVEPAPVKTIYCPFLWTGQKDLDGALPCNKLIMWGDQISNCPNYSKKAECWEVYEAHATSKENK